MNPHYRTVPGTEENLALANDIHPFDDAPAMCSDPHPVLVDGIYGRASVGTLGGYKHTDLRRIGRRTPGTWDIFCHEVLQNHNPRGGFLGP